MATDPDYELSWLIFLVRRAIHKARARELLHYEITPEQASVLFYIYILGDKVTPTDLSRWVFREPHSTSSMLSRMEKQGLVKKVYALHGKNSVRITLTSKGLEVYHQSAKRESLHTIVSSLSIEERRQLRSHLQKLLRRALQEIQTEHKILD